MEENKNSDKLGEEGRKIANEFKESWNQSINKNKENKKLITGILAIILGGFGIHKFILGYNTEGIILLVVGIFGITTFGISSSIAAMIGLIEGIIYLTKSDEEFFQTYQVNKRPWF